MLFDFYDAKLIKNVTSYLKYLMKYNRCSIGVCYEGGLNPEGHPADTLTSEQFEQLEQLLLKLLKLFPKAQLRGHRDMPGSVPKACPCLDCQSVFRAIL